MENPTYHNYIFFRKKNSFDGIAPADLEKYKKEFLTLFEDSKTVITHCYSTMGFKADTILMLWMQSASVEETQNLLSSLLKTELGKHLTISHTLFGLVRPSVYTGRHTNQEQAIHSTERWKYLVIYPFTKTKEWYLLDFDSRKKLMAEHIRMGHKYATIRQLLLYATGVDDHEFIVSYETDSLQEFQTLVIDLRSTKARLYTQNDLPLFMCVYKEPKNALDHL